MKDVVVLLPGITGSVLAKDGKDVWAPSAGAVLRGLSSLGESIQKLKLTEDPPDVDDLGDGVTAPRIVPDTHLIPGLWKIDGYGKTSKAIQSAFAVTRGENFFEFPYDWRRDNRVSARRLARESRGWLQDWRAQSGNDEAKLILVGHSMGGVVSRYFLECLDGWRDTRILVTFGTPYRGSLNALGFIANGMKKKLGPFTVADLSDLLRSFTAVYQLLPVYPCCDTGSGELVRVTEVSVPHLKRDRAESALGFHREIREAVERHEADDAYVRDRYEIRPVVGTFQRTFQSARVRNGDVDLVRSYKGEDQDGDGTVPLVSATPLELGNRPQAMYAAERHASLQNFDPVIVQLTGVLSGLDLDLDAYYAVNARLSLDVEDAFVEGEPVVVSVKPEVEGVDLLATIADDGGRVIAQQTVAAADADWLEIEFPPLPRGTYRVSVRGEFGVDSVTDIFAVFGPE
jgi:pimeloyl-ACP methyl ester carboxylesterase